MGAPNSRSGVSILHRIAVHAADLTFRSASSTEMYEAGARSLSLAGRKSPTMPMPIIDCGDVFPESTKCPSGRCKISACVHRKAKSTLSLCAGIVLCTVVLFILITELDPSKVSEDPRLLVTFPYRLEDHSHLVMPSDEVTEKLPEKNIEREEAALEGLGVVFRRGTGRMPELVVAHLSEMTVAEDLRLFLRGLHRSGMLARADLVLLFPWRPLPRNFAEIIYEEERYFQKLLDQSLQAEAGEPTEGFRNSKLSIFNSASYTLLLSVTPSRKGPQDSLWGSASAGNVSASAGTKDDGVHFGAIVGFDMQELDAGDALSGFLNSPLAGLRRWVCYQILLGMVRQHYRHALLTEVTGVFILEDIFAPLKKKVTSLHLYYTGKRWADADSSSTLPSNILTPSSEELNATGLMENVYGQRYWNSMDEEDKRRKVISTGVIMGGIRSVRSVTTAMATEIVRVALLRKSREPFNPEAILSFLVHKSSVLGKKVASHLQLHESGMSSVNLLPGPSRGPHFNDFFRRVDTRFAVLQGFKNKGVSESRRTNILQSLRRDLCRSVNDPYIYTDCHSSRYPVEMDLS